MRDDFTARDNRTLIGFWDQAFARSTEEQARDPEEIGLRDLAPSEKLYLAACSLGDRKNVLDYGCGSGWAGVIAAKSGCARVTAADAAPGAVRAARLTAERFGAADRVRAELADAGWLGRVPSGAYDGLFCSNVLDVVPPETAEGILRETARVLTGDGTAFVGLNYYLSPEAAASKGQELADGRRLYVDGVLRLVSRTDEEWAELFSPWYVVEELDHFAWPGEAKETRRLFRLRKRDG